MMLVTIAKGEQIPIPIKINIPLFSRSVAIQIWGKGEGRGKRPKRERKKIKKKDLSSRKSGKETGKGGMGEEVKRDVKWKERKEQRGD